jgi:predicted DNA-binding protein (MmcQ/YjbR family)
MDFDDALAHCLSLPGTVETYPFGDDVAVIKVTGRMFALLPLGADPPSISLKCDPDLALTLRDQYPEAVTSGYHLNKRHWNSILLDGSVPDDEVQDWIEHSWELVVAKLPKREQAVLQAQQR